MEEINYGDVRLKGSHTSINKINKNISNTLNLLQKAGMHAIDFKFSITFADNASAVKPDKESFMTDRISFDILTDFNYLPNDQVKNLLIFLNDHAYEIFDFNGNKKDTCPSMTEFVNQFFELYNACNQLIKFNPGTLECDPLKNPLDLNLYFLHNNIPYRIRKTSRTKYQLCPEHLTEY